MSGTQYPGALDVGGAYQENFVALDAIVAIEKALGLNPKGTATDVAARIAAIETAVTALGGASLTGGDVQGAFNATAIQAGAVTTAKLADSSVTSAKIVDGTVALGDLAFDPYPRRHVLQPWLQDYDATSGTWPAATVDTTMFNNVLVINNPVVQGDYLEWQNLAFAAGTWKITTITKNNTDRGIATFTIDGNTVGTVDQYAAAGTNNVITKVTGITIAQGLHTLRMAMSTKNASSTGYKCALSGLILERTGA